VTDVANVTSNDATSAAAEPETGAEAQETSAAPAADAAPAAEPRPAKPARRSPISRQQLDAAGQVAFKAVSTAGTVVTAIGRSTARVIGHLWQLVRAVPGALQAFALAGIGMLLGVFGAIALDNALGLVCTVAVIPVCAMVLGALGHRWYSGLAEKSDETPAVPVAPAPSDLQRSVEYVDRKLAVALTSIGTERHQQALIAMFQAKTAVELTLGTEEDSALAGVATLPEEQALRPRIRVGSTSKATLRESNSLAAS
jgi:hypothetical protein